MPRTLEGFKHPGLGKILLTGRIRPAPEPPYFLEVIRDINCVGIEPSLSCIPIGELNACGRLLPEVNANLNWLLGSHHDFVIQLMDKGVLCGSEET